MLAEMKSVCLKALLYLYFGPFMRAEVTRFHLAGKAERQLLTRKRDESAFLPFYRWAVTFSHAAGRSPKSRASAGSRAFPLCKNLYSPSLVSKLPRMFCTNSSAWLNWYMHVPQKIQQ